MNLDDPMRATRTINACALASAGFAGLVVDKQGAPVVLGNTGTALHPTESGSGTITMTK